MGYKIKTNKKIAIAIQITLILALGIIIFSTYRTIQNDNRFASGLNETVNADAACPQLIKRSCCSVSYCTEPQACAPLPLECNSQNDLKFCFQYSWKNTPEGKPGMCSNCNGANLNTIAYKTYRKCTPKK